jgi:serine/threonine protein kinase
MAPEVALCQVYNESCDVYSFAMLFWEILTCKKPFVKISMDQLVTNVWDGAKYRPKLEANKWSPEILDLLNKAWSPDMSLRPTMKEIEATLQIQVVEGCGIEAKESKRLSHQTRRSTYVQSKQGSSTSRMVASWFDSSSSKSLY